MNYLQLRSTSEPWGWGGNRLYQLLFNNSLSYLFLWSQKCFPVSIMCDEFTNVWIYLLIFTDTNSNGWAYDINNNDLSSHFITQRIKVLYQVQSNPGIFLWYINNISSSWSKVVTQFSLRLIVTRINCETSHFIIHPFLKKSYFLGYRNIFQCLS